METFSALLALCAWNLPVHGEFPAQRSITRSFDVYFDMHPIKRLSKQSCNDATYIRCWQFSPGITFLVPYVQYHHLVRYPTDDRWTVLWIPYWLTGCHVSSGWHTGWYKTTLRSDALYPTMPIIIACWQGYVLNICIFWMIRKSKVRVYGKGKYKIFYFSLKSVWDVKIKIKES